MKAVTLLNKLPPKLQEALLQIPELTPSEAIAWNEAKANEVPRDPAASKWFDSYTITLRQVYNQLFSYDESTKQYWFQNREHPSEYIDEIFEYLETYYVESLVEDIAKNQEALKTFLRQEKEKARQLFDVIHQEAIKPHSSPQEINILVNIAAAAAHRGELQPKTIFQNTKDNPTERLYPKLIGSPWKKTLEQRIAGIPEADLETKAQELEQMRDPDPDGTSSGSKTPAQIIDTLKNTGYVKKNEVADAEEYIKNYHHEMWLLISPYSATISNILQIGKKTHDSSDIKNAYIKNGFLYLQNPSADLTKKLLRQEQLRQEIEIAVKSPVISLCTSLETIEQNERDFADEKIADEKLAVEINDFLENQQKDDIVELKDGEFSKLRTRFFNDFATGGIKGDIESKFPTSMKYHKLLSIIDKQLKEVDFADQYERDSNGFIIRQQQLSLELSVYFEDWIKEQEKILKTFFELHEDEFLESVIKGKDISFASKGERAAFKVKLFEAYFHQFLLSVPLMQEVVDKVGDKLLFYFGVFNCIEKQIVNKSFIHPSVEIQKEKWKEIESNHKIFTNYLDKNLRIPVEEELGLLEGLELDEIKKKSDVLNELTNKLESEYSSLSDAQKIKKIYEVLYSTHKNYNIFNINIIAEQFLYKEEIKGSAYFYDQCETRLRSILLDKIAKKYGITVSEKVVQKIDKNHKKEIDKEREKLLYELRQFAKHGDIEIIETNGFYQISKPKDDLKSKAIYEITLRMASLIIGSETGLYRKGRPNNPINPAQKTKLLKDIYELLKADNIDEILTNVSLHKNPRFDNIRIWIRKACSALWNNIKSAFGIKNTASAPIPIVIKNESAPMPVPAAVPTAAAPVVVETSQTSIETTGAAAPLPPASTPTSVPEIIFVQPLKDYELTSAALQLEKILGHTIPEAMGIKGVTIEPDDAPEVDAFAAAAVQEPTAPFIPKEVLKLRTPLAPAPFKGAATPKKRIV